MVPLAAATKIRKLDPQDALQKFITGVVRPNAPDVEMVMTREKSFVNQVLRKYKNPNFDMRSPVNIQFCSAGRVEPGVDRCGWSYKGILLPSDAGASERQRKWHQIV